MKEFFAKWWFLSKFIGLTFTGSLLLTQGIENYLELCKAQSWTIVDANILLSEVKVKTSEKGTKTYYPNIKYSYTIDEKVFNSDVYQIGTKNTYNYPVQIERILKDKKKGNIIKVFVNPEDYNEATIEIGETGIEIYLVSMGFFFIFLAYAINKSTINHIIRKALVKDYQRKDEKWIVAN